jgi:hypothetical protein
MVPSMNIEDSQSGRRRPAWVWVIAVFYVLSAGYTLLSAALILARAVPLSAEQAAYFSSLTRVDWFFTLSTGKSETSATRDFLAILVLHAGAGRTK